MMNSGEIRAFKAQLSLEKQGELFDYWLSLSKAGATPRRADFSPKDIPDLLPNICLMDVRPEPEYFRVRLAGAALHDVYGREITSETLLDPGWDGARDYWRRSVEMVVGENRPAAGMLRAPTSGKEHLVQFWLRLPMEGRRPGERMILGLDICEAVSAVSADLLDGQTDHCATAGA